MMEKDGKGQSSVTGEEDERDEEGGSEVQQCRTVGGKVGRSQKKK